MEPEIPFGFVRVTGQLQKGDGVWDDQKWSKVKREPTEVIVLKMPYPVIGDGGAVAIRPCVVEQPLLPGTETAAAVQEECAE